MNVETHLVMKKPFSGMEKGVSIDPSLSSAGKNPQELAPCFAISRKTVAGLHWASPSASLDKRFSILHAVFFDAFDHIGRSISRECKNGQSFSVSLIETPLFGER
jgi:hypothetical protein